MHRIAITVVALCIFYNCNASFVFSPELQKAYKHTFSGEFNKSYTILNKKENAANGAAFYFLGYNNFLKTVFAEDPIFDENLADSHSVLIDAVEKLDAHPFKRYALAELYMQQSMIELRIGNYISALFGLRKSYVLLEKNIEKHPDFLLSKKTYYILQALLSNVPEKYKDLVELLGYKTDQYVALRELNELQINLKQHKQYGFFRPEVEIYRGVLMHKLTDLYQEAFEIIKAQTNDYKVNPVSCFIRGKIALDSKKTGEAIDILKHFAGSKCPFPYINYDIANAYLYSLDKKCLSHFGYFIQQNKGNGLLNDSYLRIARWAHLKGDEKMRAKWLKFIDPDTDSNRERDKCAITEAINLLKVSPKLLEAWLAFDGGYYEYSLRTLIENESSISTDDYNSLRFNYLQARLFQDMNSFKEAIKSFKSVIARAFDNDEYFIPVSCFNIAIIYENKLNSKKEALIYYKKCLNYKNYPYASSYKYKCELAIERLESDE
ncbi:MAG: hypothetical protein JXQ87_03940 [Bacteroidia bacterium]